MEDVITTQTVSWIAATVTAALTMSAYFHSTFETSDGVKRVEIHLKEHLSRNEKKIDRIEAKIDMLILKLTNQPK